MRGTTITTTIELAFGSPIELEFAAGVVDQGGMKFGPKFELTYEEVRSEAPKLLGPRRHSAKPVVFPQVRIAKYTVDFLVMFWDWRNSRAFLGCFQRLSLKRCSKKAETEEDLCAEEIEDFKRKLIEDEIMSGTYEVYWP